MLTGHVRGDPSLDLFGRHLDDLVSGPRAVGLLVEFVDSRVDGAADVADVARRIVQEAHLQRRDALLAEVDRLLQRPVLPRVKVQTSSVHLCSRIVRRMD